MKKTILILVLTAAMLVSYAWPALAGEAAMVVDLSGGKAVYQSGSRKGQEVQVMDFLNQGDKIDLVAGATMVLNYFASGVRENVSGPGSITVGTNSSQKGGGAAVEAKKVDYMPAEATASLSDTQHAGMVPLRATPDSSKIKLLSLDRTAVRGGDLVFKWDRVPGADKYVIVVTDLLEEVVARKETREAEAGPQLKGLRPGEEYLWTVKALSGKKLKAVGKGSFYVLDSKDQADVAGAEKKIKKDLPAGSTEGGIALVVLYTKYELNDEARAILEQLKTKHPGNENFDRQISALNTNYRP